MTEIDVRIYRAGLGELSFKVLRDPDKAAVDYAVDSHKGFPMRALIARDGRLYAWPGIFMNHADMIARLAEIGGFVCSLYLHKDRAELTETVPLSAEAKAALPENECLTALYGLA